MTDDTAVQIRRSTPGDFDGFDDCFAAICRERRYPALVDAPPKDVARAFVADAHQRGAVQYVAVANGRIVGWCDIIPHAWEGFRHCGRLGMGLASEYRGKGIGRRLVDATVRDARAAGLTRIDLEVFSSNTNAIRLYERCGFVHEGAHRRGRIIDGRVEAATKTVDGRGATTHSRFDVRTASRTACDPHAIHPSPRASLQRVDAAYRRVVDCRRDGLPLHRRNGLD